MAGSSLILFLALVGTSVALQCYGYNAYQNKIVTSEGNTHCFSIYEINGDVAFSGRNVTPAQLEAIVQSSKKQECRPIKNRNHEDEEFLESYMCNCFTDMCNFPFTFEEFLRRGKTLAPVFPKNNILF